MAGPAYLSDLARPPATRMTGKSSAQGGPIVQSRLTPQMGFRTDMGHGRGSLRADRARGKIGPGASAARQPSDGDG